MRRAPLITLSFLAGSICASCGGENAIEPGPDTGPLTAFIDGDEFIAASATTTNVQGQVTITAAGSDQRSLTFQFPDRGTSNYVIGPGNPVTAEVTIGTERWVADENGGGGTISVTDFIPSFISGSFELTLVGGPNQATMRVTSGRFIIIG